MALEAPASPSERQDSQRERQVAGPAPGNLETRSEWQRTERCDVPQAGSVPASSERTIQRTVRPDQVCVLTFDRPGSAANIFDRRTLLELDEELEYLVGAREVIGVVLASAKRSVFIAGADLHLLSESTPLDEVRAFIELGQSVMNHLAGLPMPTAAAIHGAALGGGYELCLACDYRLASLERVTKVGTPETQLGLLPAWGGSTRLPRLIGLPKALEAILGGKTLTAPQAFELGMVDQLAPAEEILEHAVRMIRQGKPHRPNRWLLNNPPVATVLARHLRRKWWKRTRGHSPAVLKALEVVTEGLRKPIPQSLALERKGILELVQTEACHNLVRLFFLQDWARKRTMPGPTLTVEPKPVQRVAVIGAGVMGAGIAQWMSAHQLAVILRDVGSEQVARGMARIAQVYQDGVRRHFFAPEEAREGLGRIQPAPTEVPLREVDLIIEAVVENLELKKEVFRRLGELAGAETILATNTSALPVSELAATTPRPERVLGLHFINPVHRMQLVEMVVGRQTAPEVVRDALRFVQRIGKLPVIVKDRPGFLVNRILMPYLIEAAALFESGARLRNLDDAMLDWGLPMGPMRLLDEVGLDVALSVTQTLAASFQDHLKVPEILLKMVQAGLLGRKTGQGFYVHRKGKRPEVNPLVSEWVRNGTAKALPWEDLKEYMVLQMVNEAVRCLEEQIVPEPAEADFAMVMGIGFPPFRGGPLRYADSVGIAKVAGAMEYLADRGLTHFEPCALLRSMAAHEQNFYSSHARASSS